MEKLILTLLFFTLGISIGYGFWYVIVHFVIIPLVLTPFGVVVTAGQANALIVGIMLFMFFVASNRGK